MSAAAISHTIIPCFDRGARKRTRERNRLKRNENQAPALIHFDLVSRQQLVCQEVIWASSSPTGSCGLAGYAELGITGLMPSTGLCRVLLVVFAPVPKRG